MNAAVCPLVTALSLEALAVDTWLIRGGGEALATLPGMKRFVAWGLTSHFVTSPFFGKDVSEIPARCQVVLWEEKDGRCGLVIPVLDGEARTEVVGDVAGLRFKTSCGPCGKIKDSPGLAIVHTGEDPFAVMRNGMAAAVKWMDRGNVRTEKRTPRWIDFAGWCTWDAFYTQVDEEKILAGLAAFQEGGFQPGFVIIDEGWQDFDSKHFLLSLGVKAGAFTGDSLKTVVREAKEKYGVQMVGCWRTLFGELRGVSGTSEGLSNFERELVIESGTEGDLFGVVKPKDVAKFHEAYSAKMAADGIDFVKVDFQSALHLMTHTQIGRAEGARIWQYALQDAVEKNFHGELLNCMAMGSDEVFHTRTSNVARSSDDFLPDKPDSHPLHIRQNAYNALWLSELEWPDWDMFHSKHPWAEYHAVGRAISGGPVYVSDKPGQSDCKLLNRFVDSRKRVLRCPQPALPTRAMLFEDPVPARKMIRVFNRCDSIGLLAVFHPDMSETPVTETIQAAEVEGYDAETSAVFSVKSGFRGLVSSTGILSVSLQSREADMLVFSPVTGGFAAIGLIDTWNPPAGILSVDIKPECLSVRSRCRGGFGFYAATSISRITVNGVDTPWTSTGVFHVVETPALDTCRIEIFRGH